MVTVLYCSLSRLSVKVPYLISLLNVSFVPDLPESEELEFEELESEALESGLSLGAELELLSSRQAVKARRVRAMMS